MNGTGGGVPGQRRPVIRAPRGPALSCKGWPQEAALRMLRNNLDPEVAEHPGELVVYGGTGKAARDWRCFDAIADGSPLAAEKLAQVLANDPATGVIRHVDAGYPQAAEAARAHGVQVPMSEPS